MAEDAPADVERLVSEGRLAEAAALCVAAGAHRRAADLFEKACDFASAAAQAFAAGDHPRAVPLAVLAGDHELEQRAIRAVLAGGSAEVKRRVAEDLSARGHHRAAAAVFRGIDDFEQAAEAFDRAGAVLEAAACYDSAGRPADAARLLEGAIRSGGVATSLDDPTPADSLDRLQATLGRLYARHGRYEPAVRVLQQLSSDSVERAGALPSLALSLERLGLSQALADLRPELRRHGIDPTKVADLVEGGGDGTAAGQSARLYGRYDIEAEVATTPHARVVRATDSLTGQRVAVKVFASRLRGTGRDALQRFAREAKVLQQLRHPNVLRLQEFIAEGPAMVIEWMAGGSLRQLVDREPISPARAAEIARALLAALAEAHRVGILHRDIKPSNLLFDEAGTPKLADFGAAHFSDSAATVTAADIGTVAYMAPEQIRGQAATVRSDIYSTGVLLFEMLAGRRPEPGDRVSSAHPDLDDSHDGLLAQMLAAEPEDRFDEAAAAQRALESLSWSARVIARDRADAAAAHRPPNETDEADRLGAPRRPCPYYDATLQRHDRWLERHLLVLPLDEASRSRAAAFGRAAHPALPLVLRADDQRGELWVDLPRGQPLAEQPQPLAAADRKRLHAALAALHRAGGVHGSVDPRHVFRHAGELYLAWPRDSSSGAEADDDLRALAEL
ncbi:MAG: serine/threonine protein kinase [Deltaproteobacteria bacterium]|jgi:serine/threonine-protein kinase|nr:serine/threonine protein kinase [Deltaproteobacteria bacterium]MBW2536982.1 serine/threonine protein kinase [Deltaproteobacteria bacterium]